MVALLALVIVLPPLLLLLGLGLGAAGTRWWLVRQGWWRGTGCFGNRRSPPCDEEAAVAAEADVGAETLAATSAAPSATSLAALPPGRKDSSAKLLPPGIHIVASSASFQQLPTRSAPSSETCLPLGLRLASPSPPLQAAGRGGSAQHPRRPAALHLPGGTQPDSPTTGGGPGSVDAASQYGRLGFAGCSGSMSPGLGGGGGGSGAPASLAGGHRRSGSVDYGQLVRAGPSVISQVMEDWEARSTLLRLMSLDAFNLPSPQQQHQQAAAAAAAGLLSPAAAALFSPVTGAGGGASAVGSAGAQGAPAVASMPAGEVHMDEIDLIECIGKGGYGCVYKAAWRGAGVAVKYIVCPTEDSDSLGRAIREVVLSKKMSHPNVVQCYAWTVLSEPGPADNRGGSATPTSRSNLPSPRGQSFTAAAAPQGAGRRRQVLTGRSSLDLLRPSSAGGMGGGSHTPVAAARRGLDLRFNVAAGAGLPGSGSMSTPRSKSSPALQRITERPTQEGRTLQQEVEAAVGPPQLSGLATTEAAEAIEAAIREEEEEEEQQQRETAAVAAAAEVEAEAAEEGSVPSPQALPCPSPQFGPRLVVVGELFAHLADVSLQAAAAGPACSDPGSSGSQLPSPEAPAACFASSKQLKLQLPLPSTTTSPSSSPGIQAVHAPASVDDAAAAQAGQGGSGSPQELAVEDRAVSLVPSPDRRRMDACSVEPASLPQSPFAAHAAQLGRFSACSAAGQLAEGCSVGSTASGPLAAAAGAGSAASAQGQGQQSVPVFGSHEEIMAHFRQLAAEGQQGDGLQQGQEEQHAGDPGCDGPLDPLQQRRLALASSDGFGRGGLWQQADGTVDVTVTAASSFSDVLSISGFMLEGTASGQELTALSLPSSPRHGGTAQRSGQGSWFHPSAPPSAAASHPTTPRTAVLGGPSRLSRATSAAPPVADGAGGEQAGAALRLAASMPLPAWPDAAAGAEAEAAEVALAPAAEEEEQLVSRSSCETVRPLALASASPEAAAEPEAAPDAGAQNAGSGAFEHQQQQEEQQEPLSAEGSSHQQQAVPRALRHSSTVSLSVWHPPAAQAPAPAPVANGVAAAGDAEPEAEQLQASPATGSSPAASPQDAGSLLGTASGAASREPSQPGLLRLAFGHGAAASGACPSGTVTPRMGSLSNLAREAGAGSASPVPAEGSPQVTPRQQSLRGLGPQVSPRADSLRGSGRATGRRRVEELREEAAAALGGTGGGGAGSGAGGDGPTSCDRLSLGSHNDSFNSEEGFGSPVKQRCGGVKDVFQLEELQLEGQEALMVVVMEFCDLGSLRKALKRKAFRPSAKWPFQTTYRALLRTAQEVAKGMGYIHEWNIVHGDLKPGNVLLKTHKVDRRGYIAKVSDFGLSRPLDWEDTHATLGSTLGTLAYTSPETFGDNCVKKPSDVYAFGIMLWEMFYCRDPYEGLLDGQICVGVTDGTLRPEFEDDCPEPYRRLAERCWHQDTELRPSFEEIDKELVRIEMEFRLHRHRATSKRGSSAGGSVAGAAGGRTSLDASRPGSPQRRVGSAGAGRQFQASELAG